MYYMLEFDIINYFCFEMTYALFSKTIFKSIGYLNLVIPDKCLLPEHIISRKFL